VIVRILILLAPLGLATVVVDPPGTTRGGDGPARSLTAPPGSHDGRQGNDQFLAGELEEAIARYEAGLARARAAGSVRSGLYNNLGTARFERSELDAARAAFEQAYATALTDTERARAAYNAGNAAALAGETAEALAHYRRALLARPDFDDARHNYEFIRRIQQPPTPEPDVDDSQDQAAAEPDDGNDGDQAEPNDQHDGGGDEPAEADTDQEGQPDDQDGSPVGPEGDDGQDGDSESGDAPGEGPTPGADGSMTPEEADRVLRAIEADEQDVMREVQRRRSRDRSHDKDW